MTREELLERIQSIEWEDFEVKTAKSEIPKSCWETISAFSNSAGGWLILGVSQTGKSFSVVGVDNPEKLEQDMVTTLHGAKFNVSLKPLLQRYIIDGKMVLAFYFPAVKQKPVYFNSPVNTFIRSGSADIRASREEIDAMYRDQSYGAKTSEPIETSSFHDLSRTSLTRYIEYMARFNRTLPYNKLSLDEFLTKTQVIIEEKLSVAGLLFFGKQDAILRLFPDFRIDLLEIPGTSYSDAQVRFTYRLAEQENLWEYFFALYERLIQKVDQPFSLTREGFANGDFPHIEALREALVNMLMHADYFSLMKSRVRIFTDRIEFFNPGRFPKPVEELMKADISLPRNPILAKLFRLVKLAENAGFGFEKMISGWRAYTNVPPVFQAGPDYSIVTFMLPNKQHRSDTREK